MQPITKIRIEHEGFAPPHKYTITRLAVRALTLRGDKLLMVLSTQAGDFKFAGGAAHDGETLLEALRREVSEETGYHVDRIGGPLIRAEEYRNDAFEKDTCFLMISEYYPCTVFDDRGAQNLDDYEAELGFTSSWITAEDALMVNARLLQNSDNNPAPWLLRETRVLEALCAMNYSAGDLLKP